MDGATESSRGRGMKTRDTGASSHEIARGSSRGRGMKTRDRGASSYEIARGSSRGRGVKTRGGGASPSNETTRGSSRGRVVSRRRGVRTRGGGSQSNEMPMLFNIEEMPSGLPLEVPICSKRRRRRTWSPTQAMVYQPSPDLSTPTDPAPTYTMQSVDVVIKVEQLDIDTPYLDAENQTLDPSPALFVECGNTSGKGMPVYSSTDKLVPSTSGTPVVDKGRTPVDNATQKSTRKKTPTSRRRIRDLEIETMLGSESESEEEEAEGIVQRETVFLPRVCQAALDTPLDEVESPSTPLVGVVPADISLDEVVPTVDIVINDQVVMEPCDFYDFQWKPFPNPPISPESRRETFSQSNVGPVTSFQNPYDVFASIWDPQIMEHIAQETNRYAQQVAQRKMDSGDIYPNSRINEWRDVTTDDIWVYFAVVLAMGIVVKTRIEEYWNTDADIFETPGFRVHINLRKFQLISACLHFNNNEDMCTRNLSASEAKLFKIQPILDHLNHKFQMMYTPRQNIALDESLLMWKGWLDINQLIPHKAASIGIKTYEVCESQTGYLWRFEIHAYKSTNLPQQQNPMAASTPAIVLRLIHGLENKGYTLWMDNYYNSPALARKLKTFGFDCVGTLRTDRQFVPQELTKLTKANMYPGQITGFTSGDVDLMVWRDKNRVATISTYHGNASTLVDGQHKPILIVDYNVMMGGVDKKDQLLAMYPIERKRTRIWYKKFFRRLLNVSVLNSYIILKQSPLIASSSFSFHRVFRSTLVKSILEKHSSALIPVPNTSQNKFDIRSHHLVEYDFLPGHSTNPGHSGRRRRQCSVCKKRGHLFCAGCNKPFCMNPCFVSYHS